jgi:hypothetical protein
MVTTVGTAHAASILMIAPAQTSYVCGLMVLVVLQRRACCICRETLTVGGSVGMSSCGSGAGCMVASCWLMRAAASTSSWPAGRHKKLVGVLFGAFCFPKESDHSCAGLHAVLSCPVLDLLHRVCCTLTSVAQEFHGQGDICAGQCCDINLLQHTRVRQSRKSAEHSKLVDS